jgi:hypothetical protein
MISQVHRSAASGVRIFWMVRPKVCLNSRKASWPPPAPSTTPTSAPATTASAPRLGKKEAIVALQHSRLTAVWHMLTDDADYHDLGGDYFSRVDPERAMRRIVRQANALGFTVRFDPIQTA